MRADAQPPSDPWYPGKYLGKARDVLVAAAPGMQGAAAGAAESAQAFASKVGSGANKLGKQASDASLGRCGGTLPGQIRHSHAVLSALANPAEPDNAIPMSILSEAHGVVFLCWTMAPCVR